MTAQCYKQGPSDGGFVAFGGTQTLSNGGNTGTCNVDGSILSTSGNYSFEVIVTAGPDTATDTTSVTFNNGGPGDPHDYNKSQQSCQYTIHFVTANDSGKTVKVELYRSTSVPFNADSGSRIQTISAGSNEPHDTTDTPPSCSQTYYYAIRSFDSAGNGSALVGDSVTQVTVITPTPGAGGSTGGAIPVSGTNGNVLGSETSTGTVGPTGSQGQVEGAASSSAEVVSMTPTPAPKQNIIQAHPKRTLIALGLLILLGAGSYVFFSKKNRSQDIS